MDVLRISIRRVERERERGENYDFTSSIFFWKELNQGNQVWKRFELNRQGEGFFFLIRRMDLIDSVDEGEGGSLIIMIV